MGEHVEWLRKMVEKKRRKENYDAVLTIIRRELHSVNAEEKSKKGCLEGCEMFSFMPREFCSIS